MCKRIQTYGLIALLMALAQFMCGQNTNSELCMDGTLLFREDFGGNDPNDPEVSTTPVPGMQYPQIFSTQSGMERGRYLVTKSGYVNGNGWFIMDDHTFSGDYTRGYFLQVDGGGGNTILYTNTLNNVSPGMQLSFSASMANVTTPSTFLRQQVEWKYIYPQMAFIIENAQTGAEIARYNTDTISHDWSHYGESNEYQYSAQWQSIGMNFTVPEGVTSIKLKILNTVAVSNASGNDFVIDDIEVRICEPPEPISELCLDGMLLFREDFGGNNSTDPAISKTRVPGMSSGYQQIYKLQTSDPGTGMGAGCYLVAKRGYRNSSISTYSVWHIMDDHTYFGDTTRGYLLEIDGKGSGNDVFYSTVIDGLCAGSRLTFSAYVANLTTAGQYNAWRDRNYVHPKLSFVLTHPQTGAELARYNTDTISHDWSNYPKSWRETADWQLIGMNFIVPEGIDAVRLSIRNNASGSSTGNDFALDDIEIRLCLPPVTVSGDDEVCQGAATTLTAGFVNDGTLVEPLEYKWWHSTDSLTWTELSATSAALSISSVQDADTGWYKVAVSGAGNIESVNCRAVSEPFLLHMKSCSPSVRILSPDSVCPNSSCTFDISITNEDQIPTPLQYQWWYRSPEYPNQWRKVGGNTPSLLLRPFQTQHVGWYKIRVAQEGHINDEANYIESDEVFVTFKKCEPDLCMDGTLLYKDDFGGNDPNDPRVGTAPVPGMSYQQLTSDRFGVMSSGRYLVTKSGYCNGDTAALRRQYGYLPNWGSQWILQDDHTYPGDYSRGYFVEIDGAGGESPFYSTTIHDLCPGTQLVFSAYVVNVHFYEQVQKFFRQNRTYVYPRMKFVLKNPDTGDILAQQSTGDIQPDVTKAWNIFLRESAEWQHVGLNFTVPVGVESVQMYIYNDTQNGTGNDFAMDDIEIRLCMPPVTVSGDDEVCQGAATTLTAGFVNDGTLVEPLEYKWWHSTDSLTWTELSATSAALSISSVQDADTGWYKVAVSGAGNIESVNCRALSEPFHMAVKECSMEETLCMDGVLLFREDFGGNKPEDPKISTTPVPGMSYAQVTTDTYGSMGAGKYLVTKQGYCNGNGTSQWHLQDDHTHFGDLTRGYLLEIDGIAGSAAFYQTTIDHLCEGIELTFSAYVANVMTWGMYMGRPGMYAYPRLKFVLSNPSDNSELATYDTGDIPFDSAFIGDNMCWKQSVEWRLVGMNFTVPVGVESIQLSIYNNVSNSNGNDFAIDDIEIHLCMTPDTVKTDTLVCDTISRILWREKSFALADTLRDTVFSSCGFDSIYYILTIQTEHCEEPEPVLCTDGILLFREDFGGNDPNESRVSSMPVPGMSYTQSTYGMGSGTYMVTKSGYCNGDTTGWTIPGADLSAKRSQWYIQDDHTYPNDRTRGYFLEIDGSGGTQQFYQTEISGLCEGIELTFSAYVANVFTWFQYDWYTKNRGPVVSPCLKFVLTNPQTGQKLAEQNTQEIPFDNNLPAKTDWQYSSAWHLVGMNFTVPVGVDAIRLSIYNNVTNGNGNDFALDDIEIHLCMTPDTVVTDTLLCDTISKIQWRGKTFAITDTLRDTLRSSCGFDSIYYMMRVETEHCEPPCPEIHYATRDTTVCDTLMPFTWHGLLFNKPGSQTILLKDEQGCDSIEIDYTLSTFHCEDFCLEGELLFREDFGGNDAGDSEISCAHVSGIANFYTNACQEVRKHPEYGMSTMNYVLTKKGQGNRQWHVQDDHTYPNDYTRGYFLEVDGYGGTIYKTTVNNLYEGMELTFSAYIANLHDSCVIANMRKNYGYTYPRFKFILKDAESNAELATYTTGNILPDITTPCVLAKSALWQLKGMKYVVPEGVSSIQMLINNDVASYDGNDFGIDDIEIRLCYMPAKKIVQDTIICDTIDNIVWRNKIYPLKNELRDTVYDSSEADSIYYILNVIMEHCCPDLQTIYVDSAVCDTLLPFLWMYRDTMLLFERPGSQEVEVQHAKWEKCVGTVYTLTLDTFHCERFYPIIVNKYNWQLVCDNVALRRFFPDNKALAFQWYKNGEPIPGANEDDYAEQNELNGIFQLQIRLDAVVDNDDEYIWSNILEIGEVQAPEPIVKKVYHWWSLTIIRYQQGDRVWYEKKLR